MKNFRFKQLLSVLSLAFIATSAQAITVNATAGQFTSNVVGAITIDFDAPLPSGVTMTGGAVYAPPTQVGISAVPVGSTGNFYSVGTSPVAQQGPGVIKLATNVDYYGFLWGSVDTYNSVSLWNGANLVTTILGSSFLPANGDQSQSIYLDIFANNVAEYFNEIRFSSSNNAFETDNHAFSAVPLPAALPLLLSALGAFGLSRRKNKAQA